MKEKTADEMFEELGYRKLNKKEDECFEQNKLCDDCIKEYFYNKVEIPEEN